MILLEGRAALRKIFSLTNDGNSNSPLIPLQDAVADKHGSFDDGIVSLGVDTASRLNSNRSSPLNPNRSTSASGRFFDSPPPFLEMSGRIAEFGMFGLVGGSGRLVSSETVVECG